MTENQGYSNMTPWKSIKFESLSSSIILSQHGAPITRPGTGPTNGNHVLNICCQEDSDGDGDHFRETQGCCALVSHREEALVVCLLPFNV